MMNLSINHVLDISPKIPALDSVELQQQVPFGKANCNTRHLEPTYSIAMAELRLCRERSHTRMIFVIFVALPLVLTWMSILEGHMSSSVHCVYHSSFLILTLLDL